MLLAIGLGELTEGNERRQEVLRTNWSRSVQATSDPPLQCGNLGGYGV